MGWQDQGRKEHGWFGDGTAPQAAKDASAGGGDGPDGLARRIQGVVHAAVAALPTALRRRAEAQLDGGGLSRLSEALTVWSRGAGLGKTEWAERMLGRDAGDRVAGMLHVAALGAASGSSHVEGRQASEALAGAMQVVGLDHWSRFVADAQARARDAAAASIVQVSASRTIQRVNPKIGEDHFHKKNEYDLAKVIHSEASGENDVAKAAVGWTLRNRMLRNGSKIVSASWHGYAHNSAPDFNSFRIAKGILNGSIADPTDGATHFYTPEIMPAKGDSTVGKSVGGGLELVPGVLRNRKNVETYRPSWANDPNFSPRPVGGIDERTFKFYKQDGNGFVR